MERKYMDIKYYKLEYIEIWVMKLTFKWNLDSNFYNLYRVAKMKITIMSPFRP